MDGRRWRWGCWMDCDGRVTTDGTDDMGWERTFRAATQVASFFNHGFERMTRIARMGEGLRWRGHWGPLRDGRLFWTTDYRLLGEGFRLNRTVLGCATGYGAASVSRKIREAHLRTRGWASARRRPNIHPCNPKYPCNPWSKKAGGCVAAPDVLSTSTLLPSVPSVVKIL